jgi:hypothetical protein
MRSHARERTHARVGPVHAHLGGKDAHDGVLTTTDKTKIRGGVKERAPQHRDWGVCAGEVFSLRVRVCARVHVSAH